MSRDRTRLAACIALAYVLIVLGGIFLRFLQTGDAHTLKFSFTLPGTWVASFVGAAVAWGLWHRLRWAWWLGFVAGLVQLLRMSWWMAQHFSLANFPGLGVVLVLGLLVAFLTVLLLPGTRSACSRIGFH